MTEQMSEAAEREHYTLPEQRIRLDVVSGGRGSVHVIEHRTFKTDAHPGRWTRRAADRQAFCGSLRACIIGVDATDWPTERGPVDLTQVTCKRCRERAERILPAPGSSPSASPADQERRHG